MASLWDFDQIAIGAKDYIIGIDEAGRGPFAGSVVASAVCVEKSFFETFTYRERTIEINDSKQLSSLKRQAYVKEIESIAAEGLLFYGIGKATVKEIETYNILGATIKAMVRALKQVVKKHKGFYLPLVEDDLPLFKCNSDRSGMPKILIDGKPIKKFPYTHEGIVKGDGKSLVIAMASIFAKETRDADLLKLDKKYPQYGFAKHKGYGTKFHREKILEYGPCPEHRLSFLRNLLGSKISKP